MEWNYDLLLSTPINKSELNIYFNEGSREARKNAEYKQIIQFDIVIGTIIFGIQKNIIYISTLVIDELYKNKGNGTNLVKFVKKLGYSRKMNIEIGATSSSVLFGYKNGFTFTNLYQNKKMLNRIANKQKYGYDSGKMVFTTRKK